MASGRIPDASLLWNTSQGVDKAGGESGIRTHVRVSPKHAFQACAFSHSAISPAQDGTGDIIQSDGDEAAGANGSATNQNRIGNWVIW